VSVGHVCFKSSLEKCLFRSSAHFFQLGCLVLAVKVVENS